ncbi:hypothetical protein HMPREF3209_02376, partial [Lactobacillus crispatus]
PGFDPLATHNMKDALQEGGAFFMLFYRGFVFFDHEITNLFYFLSAFLSS